MTEAVSEGVGELRWRSHPAGERPVAAAALLVIMLAASAVAAWWGGSVWWGIVGFAMLVLSMWGFLLPCEYRMDAAGVSKRSVFGTEARSWREVRSFTVDRWGMLLSPFPKPTRLAKFRGVSLQFAPGNREEVVAFVRARYAGRSAG